MSARTPVAVVGASGYPGAELCRLLLEHPRAAVAGVYGRTRAGERYAAVFPQFAGRLDLVGGPCDADAGAARARVAFLALPHHDSIAPAAALLARGVPVLDLSADFRLKSAAEYQAWYGAHEHPELLAEAVYGLPELHRARLARPPPRPAPPRPPPPATP